MGLQDRDYLREERPAAPVLEPVRRHPRMWVMLALLVAWQAVQWKHLEAHPGEWYGWWWLSAESLGQGRLWVLLTASLCHENVIHLFVNGVALALCARACEDEGRTGWFWFAPVAAILGHAGVVLIGGSDVTPTAGAEGAVLGWATALALHPGRSAAGRKASLFPLAVALVGGLGFRITSGGGVAMLGLLAAVPFGAAAALLVRDKQRPVVESAAGGVTPSELDRLLARVSEVGMEGLTDEERAALQSASKGLRSGR